MGGQPSLGYDVKDRKLIVNEAEATTVRMIFRRYLELGSVRVLKAALDEEGVASKLRTAGDGGAYGGKPFSRGGFAGHGPWARLGESWRTNIRGQGATKPLKWPPQTKSLTR